MGLAESEAFAAELVQRALKALEPFDTKANPLRSIAGYIIERKR